jgi:hypothetical protein
MKKNIGMLGIMSGLIAMSERKSQLSEVVNTQLIDNPFTELEKKVERISRNAKTIYRNPPRSMTPEEQEYYAKHKHLNGFITP